MNNLKLRKVGNSVVVTIPVDVLDRYGLKEGDSLRARRWANGLMLTPETSREQKVRIGRHEGKS